MSRVRLVPTSEVSLRPMLFLSPQAVAYTSKSSEKCLGMEHDRRLDSSRASIRTPILLGWLFDSSSSLVHRPHVGQAPSQTSVLELLSGACRTKLLCAGYSKTWWLTHSGQRRAPFAKASVVLLYSQCYSSIRDFATLVTILLLLSLHDPSLPFRHYMYM